MKASIIWHNPLGYFMKMVGLSIHIGSQIQKLKPFEHAFKKVAKQISFLKKLGFEIQILDLGGGIGIRYLKNDKIINLNEYCNQFSLKKSFMFTALSSTQTSYTGFFILIEVYFTPQSFSCLLVSSVQSIPELPPLAVQ